MIDNVSTPGELEDTQAETNPYEITDKIWSLIEHYFISKYDVEFKEAYPSKEVTRPTIVAMVQKRTPGRDGSRIHGKGPNFAKFLKNSPDGYVHEVYIQQQEILIEYSVYAVSTAEVKRIAWDLERAILETVGILQSSIEGFQLVFEQQTQDSSMLWRQQDELIKRTIRFKALLPVKFVKVVPELRYIELIESWGTLSVTSTGLTRSSSDKVFYITTSTGQRVSAIRNVFVKEETYPFAWITLTGGTDFFIKKDRDQIPYIEWNDDYGKVPSVGDAIRVDYELAQLVKRANVKPQI